MQDDPEATTAGSGHTAGECKSAWSMFNVSRWSRCVSSGRLCFTGAERKQIYGLVERTLQAHEYLRLPKKDKGVVRRYLAKISGRSLAQATRLIRRYGPDDIALPGRRRCGPRGAFGSGAAAHPVARIPRLGPGRLATIGLSLGLAHLQPAAHRDLSRTPRPSHPHALARGGHRRAAAAQPAWQAGGKPARQRISNSERNRMARHFWHGNPKIEQLSTNTACHAAPRRLRVGDIGLRARGLGDTGSGVVIQTVVAPDRFHIGMPP